MSISREKCLEWEDEISRKLGEDALFTDTEDWLVEFAIKAYAEGQRDMRERAAKACETAEIPIDIDVWMGTKKALTAATAIGLSSAIRALEIE